MAEYTFVLQTKLTKAEDRRSYIFSFCENNICYFCYEQNGRIFFGCNKNPSPENCASTILPDLYTRPGNLFFHVSKINENFRLTIYYNAEPISHIDTPINPERDMANCFFIGCNFDRSQFGRFKLYQYLAFGRALQQAEINQLNAYLNSTLKQNVSGKGVFFNGHAFFYKNAQGHLIQDNPEYQPISGTAI